MWTAKWLFKGSFCFCTPYSEADSNLPKITTSQAKPSVGIMATLTVWEDNLLARKDPTLSPEESVDLLACCSVYFECSDGGGVLEWNAVNDTFVHQHSNKGTIFGTPRDDRIFVTNSANSSSTILIPGGAPLLHTELRFCTPVLGDHSAILGALCSNAGNSK